ncbi:2445_t:CDS:2 [Rhizophagus irregularis]|nr:2445_t:CDS:2 [Rhizophagus irregularis]
MFNLTYKKLIANLKEITLMVDDEKELVVNYKKVKLNHKGDDNLNSEQGELKISDDGS